MPELEKRTWIYVQRPKEYEIAPCPCGNQDPDWSEFKGHLWCQVCMRDFIPEHSGIFGGPVLINTCALLGIDLRRFDLRTHEILPAPAP